MGAETRDPFDTADGEVCDEETTERLRAELLRRAETPANATNQPESGATDQTSADDRTERIAPDDPRLRRPPGFDNESTFILLEAQRKLQAWQRWPLVEVQRHRSSGPQRSLVARQAAEAVAGKPRRVAKKVVRPVPQKLSKPAPKRGTKCATPQVIERSSHGAYHRVTNTLHLCRELRWALALSWLLPGGGLYLIGHWGKGALTTICWLLGVLEMGFAFITWQALGSGLSVSRAELWPVIYVGGFALVLTSYLISYYTLFAFAPRRVISSHRATRDRGFLSVWLPGAGQMLNGHRTKALVFLTAFLTALSSACGLLLFHKILAFNRFYFFDTQPGLFLILLIVGLVGGLLGYLIGIYDAAFYGAHPEYRWRTRLAPLWRIRDTDWRFLLTALLLLSALAYQFLAGDSLAFYRQQVRRYRHQALVIGLTDIARQAETVDRGLGRLQRFGKKISW